MKILFVHEINYESKVVYEVHEFPELFALAGHEIHFLDFPENAKNSKFKLSSYKNVISGRVFAKASIVLHRPPTFFNGNFIDRLLATLLGIPQIFRLLKQEQFDAIVLYSVPTSGWQVTYFAKKLSIPVIFRALDVSHLIRGGITARLVKVAERYVYANVTHISANNPELAKYAHELSGGKTPTSVEVPPLDLEHFSNGHPNLFRTKYEIDENNFVIIFMGTLFAFSGLVEVIESFSKYVNPESNIKAMIVGSGELENEIKSKIKTLKLDEKIICTGKIDYSELPDYFAAADVAINSFERKFLTDVAFPHKVLQYMAAGLPVVSTKLNGLFGVLGENAGVHWVEAPSDVIPACIELSQKSKQELAGYGKIGSQFVTETFAKDNAFAEFEKQIKNVISEKRKS